VSEVIRVLAVIAIIGYVIGRQLMGEPLPGQTPWHPPQPPAGDADPAGHPGTGQGGYVPRAGGAAPDLATLARLAGEWLAARRERGR
jgi:hypothetical protein